MTFLTAILANVMGLYLCMYVHSLPYMFFCGLYHVAAQHGVGEVVAMGTTTVETAVGAC